MTSELQCPDCKGVRWCKPNCDTQVLGQPAPVQVTDPNFLVDYSSAKTPPNYVCGECGVAGCKLWRRYQTFLDHQKLFCVYCAASDQEKNVRSVDRDGRIKGDMGLTDQIGWLIPAVPTEENDTFWGYTSVPETGCEWWRRLPSEPDNS